MLIELFITSLLTWTVGGKPNILFIIVDDLRPALGCYGDKNAYTPNIDSLAKNSVLFTQAFAQQSLCAPSRNSLLTGRRPDSLQLYDFYSYWRNRAGNFTTLPQHLKNNGYHTMSIGKVFHPGISSNGSDDSPYSWTEKPFHPYTDRYKEAHVCRNIEHSLPAKNLVCPVQISLQPNGTLPDIEIASAAKSFLQSHEEDHNPFFLAVGFQKPHIPLKYPEEYLKFHPINKFSTPNHYSWPENISTVAYNPWTDLRRREDVEALILKFPWEKIPTDFARKIIQSYYAAVTYVDHLIGMLLDQLQASKLRENTIIILTSDHGWSLGEHAEWAKYSNFDVALRVPLLISMPDKSKIKNLKKTTEKFDKSRKTSDAKNSSSTRSTRDIFSQEVYKHEELGPNKSEKRNFFSEVKHSEKNSHGLKIDFKLDLPVLKKIKRKPPERSSSIDNKKHCSKVNELVELVDLFPTIAELAELAIKICPESDEGSKINLCSEGLSFLPLVKAVQECKTMSWKRAAFSQYPRPGMEPTSNPNSDKPRLKQISIMGYTLRTKQFRYTAWIPFSSDKLKPNWDTILAEELYDHSLDPDENSNKVFSHKFSKIKEELRQTLREGWRHVLPNKEINV